MRDHRLHGDLVGLLLPLHDVDLAHPVRLVLGRELRKGQVIAGERVDTVEHDPSRDAVVPVRGEEVVRAVRVLGNDEVGAPLSDLAGDVPPEVARVRDLSVVPAEELDVRHPERPRGVPLFALADSREAVRGHRAVARPRRAAGDDHIGDLSALPDQRGHGASRARLRVVGVGHHHDHALEHRRPPFGWIFMAHGAG